MLNYAEKAGPAMSRTREWGGLNTEKESLVAGVSGLSFRV